MAEFKSFCEQLSKIELHAHLTGSIRRGCLHEIWLDRKEKDPAFELQDPLEVIPADGVTDIMAFFPLFSKYIYHLCNDVATVGRSTTSVLHDFHNDGVVYLELRTTPRHNAATGLTKTAYVETVLRTIAEFPGAMKTNLILSVDRRDSLETATETVDLAIRYRNAGVVGVDLCGDPTKGEPHVFRTIFARAKSAGLGLTLHFAEIAATSSDAELETLLSFGPDRIGHVIHVSDHIKRRIATMDPKPTLELCISCNVQVGLDPRVQEHRDHHFGEWWREGTNPIVVCTDDVGIFSTSCSNEYLLVATHFGLSEQQLWELAFGAVNSIFADDVTKTRLCEIFLSWRENNM
ncbi:hypothetical protein BZA05DRAFT_412286 [Tricharina praecox]|uniref:uncharacterized protein n=1 Tax=Tricharina praecox TaxID=43433 RepID=UPI00221EEDAC|nr:uncharacterized protein BZA05DRAFT_412286 [Tricharina praecox]KAI5842297.1 hypothetical protein BZA05DRAFT_412286 [Tricharina praecox]